MLRHARDAFPDGAATEIVIDGQNGMRAQDEAEVAMAAEKLGSIDPQQCRSSVAEYRDVAIVTAGYEHVYRRTINLAHTWDHPPHMPASRVALPQAA